jgi:hypothetical protein
MACDEITSVREFVANWSESVFAEPVTWRIGLVHSAAARREVANDQAPDADPALRDLSRPSRQEFSQLLPNKAGSPVS